MTGAPGRQMLDQDEAIRQRTSGSYNGAPRTTLPERDVRRKRPPLIRFLLKLETLRRLVRVVSLLLLDLGGVVAALFTAMALKLALLGNFTFHDAWGDMHQSIAFAYLVTVLMFARVDLYSDRPRRPRPGPWRARGPSPCTPPSPTTSCSPPNLPGWTASSTPPAPSTTACSTSTRPA